MAEMMQQMNQMEITCDPDIDFAQMMIMHHEAGIEMAEAELQYGHEEEAMRRMMLCMKKRTRRMWMLILLIR